MNTIEQELATIKKLRETASSNEQLAWLLANSFPQEENGYTSHIFSPNMTPTIALIIDSIYFGNECPAEWKIYEEMIKDAYGPYSIEVKPEKDICWQNPILTAHKDKQPDKRNIPATINLICGSIVRSEKVFLTD